MGRSRTSWRKKCQWRLSWWPWNHTTMASAYIEVWPCSHSSNPGTRNLLGKDSDPWVGLTNLLPLQKQKSVCVCVCVCVCVSERRGRGGGRGLKIYRAWRSWFQTPNRTTVFLKRENPWAFMFSSPQRWVIQSFISFYCLIVMLDPIVQCWIEILRISILVLLLNLEGKQPVLHH